MVVSVDARSLSNSSAAMAYFSHRFSTTRTSTRCLRIEVAVQLRAGDVADLLQD